MLKKLASLTENSLLRVFYRQLTHYKWFLVCLLMVWGNAAVVVIVTHKIRAQTALLEQLNTEQHQLEQEWESLRLEQGALAEHHRISVLAKEKLNMKNVSANDEKILEVY